MSRLGKGVLIALTTLGGLVAAAVVAFVLLVVLYDPRQDIDLRGFTDGQQPYMSGARDATQAICGEEVNCLQAVDSLTITLTKFATEDEAARQAETYGPAGERSGWIAVHFKPNGLSDDDRRAFMKDINMINSNS